MSKSSEFLIKVSPISYLSNKVSFVTIAQVVLNWEAFFRSMEGPGVAVPALGRRGGQQPEGGESGTKMERKDGPIRRSKSRDSSIRDGRASACERERKKAFLQGQSAAKPAGSRSARAFPHRGWVRSPARDGTPVRASDTQGAAIERGKKAPEHETGPRSLGGGQVLQIRA